MLFFFYPLRRIKHDGYEKQIWSSDSEYVLVGEIYVFGDGGGEHDVNGWDFCYRRRW